MQEEIMPPWRIWQKHRVGAGFEPPTLEVYVQWGAFQWSYNLSIAGKAMTRRERGRETRKRNRGEREIDLLDHDPLKLGGLKNTLWLGHLRIFRGLFQSGQGPFYLSLSPDPFPGPCLREASQQNDVTTWMLYRRDGINQVMRCPVLTKRGISFLFN